MKKTSGDKAIRKSAEENLTDALLRFNSLADTSQEGILIIDNDYRIIFANKEMEKISGYEIDEIITSDFRILIADESKQYVEERYKKRQSGQPVDPRYTITMVCKDGTRKRIAISASIYKTSEDKIETIAYILDVTEKEKIEKTLYHRLEFEQTIASISTIFISFSAERLDKMVSYALRKIAEVNEFDRAYLYMFSTTKVVMELTHEWCRETECVNKNTATELLTAALPWIVEKLNRQENISVTNINELPEDAVEEKRFFKDRGVKSFLIVPLIFNQTLTGFLGFESFIDTKEWFPEDIHLMNIAAETIINAYKRKWSERALKESEERFRGIYETANIGIYRYSQYHILEMANPALLEMLGYNSFEDLASVDLCKRVFADMGQRKLFEDLLKKLGNLSGYETQWLNTSTGIIEMSENARAVKDEKGNLLYYEGFVENISEKKKAREYLIKAKEEAEKSSKMKTDFIEQMSHEIRTPITAIINNINMVRFMLSGNGEHNYDVQFDTISQGGMRLIRTIDMIVDMSEIQSGNYKATFGNYDLVKDILNKQVEKYRQVIENKNLAFHYEPDKKDSTISCDFYSANQIFEQVIDNAVKFTDEGEVEIILNETDNKWEVIIQDTGIGINEEYLPRIFDAFTQQEEGTNRRYEGNGLGLSLTKEYCNINNWGIIIQSELGRGTKVTLKLN